MNGHDIFKWQLCEQLATDLELEIKPRGEGIEIKAMGSGKNYGVVSNLNELYGFLCGFDWGTNQ